MTTNSITLTRFSIIKGMRSILYLAPIIFIGVFEPNQAYGVVECTITTGTYNTSTHKCTAGSYETWTIDGNDNTCANTALSCVYVAVGTTGDGTFLYNCGRCSSGYKRVQVPVTQFYAASFCRTSPGNIYICEPCGEGYYSSGGTATTCTACAPNTYGGGGSSSSCKACPEHASCNGTTFTCASGYTKTDDACLENCSSGYYRSGTSCVQCPLADDVWTNSSLTTKARYTSSAGATSINECYLPSGTTYYDTKGTFKFSTTCNYE